MKITIPLIFILILAGCATTTTAQKSVDIVTEQIPKGKAVVIFDASINDNESPMMVIFKDPKRVEKSSILDKENKIQFTNYPGKEVGFYAGNDPYRLHAYQIDAGEYEISGCVFKAPEIYRCIGWNWLNKGQVVGKARFSVNSGEVVNLGHIHLSYEYIKGENVEIVEIKDNRKEVDKYLSTQLPSLKSDVVYKPFSFTE